MPRKRPDRPRERGLNQGQSTPMEMSTTNTAAPPATDTEPRDDGYDRKFLNFGKYVRRHELARFIVQYELFKRILDIKGCVVECGVYEGSGVMTWAKLSAALEPYAFLRKVYGFDTFEGFTSVSAPDLTGRAAVANVGRLRLDYDVIADLNRCIRDFDETRYLSHIEKVVLVRGDATLTIPEVVRDNQHLLVALLYLDFDLYEPTMVALEHFLPRMPKGAIVAFDEANDPKWPGETRALLETFNLNNHKLESLPCEPHISWITL